MANRNISSNTPLWDLPPSVLTTSAARLLVDDQWKQLAALIQRKRDGKLKFPTAGDIKILEASALARREKPSMALLDYMGTQHYTIGDLIDLLVKGQLFWVAEYLHGDILKLGPVPQPKEEEEEEGDEEQAVMNSASTVNTKKPDINDTTEFSGPPKEPSTVEISTKNTVHMIPPALPPRQARSSSHSKPCQNDNTEKSQNTPLHLRDAKTAKHIREVRTKGTQDSDGKIDVSSLEIPRSYSSHSTQEIVGRFESYHVTEEKNYEGDNGMNFSPKQPDLQCSSSLKNSLSSEKTVIAKSNLEKDLIPVCISHSTKEPSHEVLYERQTGVCHQPSQPHKLPLIQRDSGPVEQEEVNNEKEWTFTPGQPITIQYSTLERISAGFNEETLENGGRLVGKGGFGQVFLGTPSSGPRLAVKRFYDNFSESSQKQFANEIKSMAKLNNKNLLPLLGFSTDGPYLCILYPYMANGSLEDQLRKKKKVPTATLR